MAAPIDLLLSRLERVHQSGPDTWRAACPAHGEGKKQTLAVREMPDGRVLLRCFAECNVLDIVHAVGLELSDLFPARTWPMHPHRRERFHPADVLRAVAFELTVAVAYLRAHQNGDALTKQDHTRFRECVERLIAAEGMTNGQ